MSPMIHQGRAGFTVTPAALTLGDSLLMVWEWATEPLLEHVGWWQGTFVVESWAA